MVVCRETTTASTNDPTYRYSCRIKVWGGAAYSTPPTEYIAELLATPNPESLGVFNISTVLKDIITPGNALAETNVNTAGNFNCQIIVGDYLAGTYTERIVSDPFIITDGYAIQQQTINEYANFINVNNCAFILTESRRVGYTYSGKGWMHVFAANNVAGRYIKYTDAAGESYTLSMPSTPIIWRFPSGPAQVDAASSNMDFDASLGYKIELINVTGDVVLDTVNIIILADGFCDMDIYTVAYVNRYGVWDYIHFRGSSRTNITRNSSTFNRRIGFIEANRVSYVNGTSQKGVIDVMGMQTLSLNSGFVTEVMNDKFQDLMMSKAHYANVVNKSLILTTTAWQVGQRSDEDLINYSMDFEIAGNIIQDIE
jgi:hypothetical protein